ncbi:MAG: rod shape-determining protein MreD [Polynucleobacter sp.]
MIESGYILRPANPLFIGFSLFAALLLNFLPLGNAPWVPDWLLICLVFWTIYQPRRVGVIWAFSLGLIMDVHNGSLLGQHAFMYPVIAFFGIYWQRRVLGFARTQQALHLLPLFFAASIWPLAIRWIASGELPLWAWASLFSAFIEALLWPVAVWLLLAPQRRPTDVDLNRPI